jgi:hypothetical protein
MAPPFRFRPDPPPVGKWNAARYALQKTTSDDDEGINFSEQRGARHGRFQTKACPMCPIHPMPMPVLGQKYEMKSAKAVARILLEKNSQRLAMA